MRRSLPSPGLALLLVLAACHDDPAGPRRGGPAYLAVQPVFGSAVELASFGLIADTVRLDVVRPPADTLRTLTVFFDPDSSQIRLGANVPLRVPVETLAVHLELRGGGFALFSGTAPVEVRAGQPGTPHEILLAYTGPGSNVASVTIAPRDTVLTFGDSLRFHVTARDLAGAPVSLFYVLWGASDSTALRMTPTGLARAPGARATLWVRARTPTGVGDSTPVTVVPVPTLLSLVSGLAQSAIVGTLLTQPLRVRLTAADGLGVKGVPVRFRASGAAGGGVADSVVMSDTSGYAQTRVTLGSIAGPQSFEARAGALPAVTFGATALAGAVSTAASLVTASVTSILSGAITTLTLRAKDAFGNNLTTGGLTVAFTATGGTSTGAIGATTDHGDGTYTAPFTGLLAGSALTIGATINGSPVTSSPLPTLAVLPGAVAQVVVAPVTATLDALGRTQRFSASALDASGNVIPGPAFTWTSDNPLVAPVDVSGIVTALANGGATITATTNGISGSATCSVAQVVRSVVLSPASAALAAVGLPQQFSAVALDGNGRTVAGQTFAWSSSDPVIATVDGTGLATGLAPGSVTITATTAGASGTATLSVQQVLTSVVVSPATATLNALGLTQSFSAVARDAGGNVILGRTFAWSASPAGVATIDPVTGIATALANGVATIAATTGGVSGMSQLSVAQIVTAVVVNPASATLSALGLKQQFTAVAQDANGKPVAGQVFTWSSSLPAIASVDQNGLATGLAIGSALITAATAGVTGSATLSIAQTVGSVVVSPATAALDALGVTQQLTATAKDASGNVIPGRSFTWKSDNPLVASVDPSGVVTAVGNGLTTITATTGGVAGTAALSVAQIVTSVVVSPVSTTLDALGRSQQFTAVAQDRNGKTVAGQVFSWSAAPTGVATIDPATGLATTVANGLTTITATTAGVSGTSQLSVAQVVRSVVVSPASWTLSLSSLILTKQFSAVALDGNQRAVAGQTFTWTSLAPLIARVDGNGLATALAVGLAIIKVTTGGFSDQANLQITL